MSVEKLEMEDGEQAVSKGYYLSKSLALVLIFLFIITVIGLIAGISLIASSENSCKSELSAALSDIQTSKPTTTTTTTTSTQTTTTYTTGNTVSMSSTTTKQTDIQTITTSTTITPTSTSTITTTILSTSTQTTLITNPTTSQAPVKIDYRLPKNLVPYKYDILVKPQFENLVNNGFPYDGEVTISFSCIENTNNLIFHINKLLINNSTLKVTSLTDTSFTETVGFSWRNDFERQFFVASLSQTFKANNNYTVFIQFTGYLTDDNAGFYRSSYLDNNQKRRWLLASQMEPTDARKSFPCFDEPALKAVFIMRVEHLPDYNAISNMPIFTRSPQRNGNIMTVFEPTLKMSSYLVGLVVSDFTCINGTAVNAGPKGNLPIRVCARPNVPEAHLNYSLSIGIRVIEAFERLYDVKYPLPKCDHLAIPDFAAGAMENWGIITYRESTLIYIDGVTSQANQQSITTIIVHELAHMWFGDIVSPEWWNDLWLNEGFANFMQHVGTDLILPEWGLYEQLTNQFLSVQQVDSVASSHEIATDVNNPDEINEIFDDITYSKGGSVIRMANYFIGNQTFYKGITKYLNEYLYGNAVQDNLWAVLDKEAKEDGKLENLNLTNIMNTWTRQMGHPVVTIQKVNSSTINITQKHFLLDSNSQPVSSPLNYKWFIPYTHSVETIDSTNPAIFSLTPNNLWEKVIWFTPDESSKLITLPEPLVEDKFILANLEVSGFYRVNYENDNWNLIAQQLLTRKDAIPTRSRAQIIHDIFSFSQAGLVNVVKPFEIIKYMSYETEYLPWSIAISRLNYLTNMLESTGSFGKYQSYLVELINPIYNNLGWDPKPDDTWLQRLIRTNILSFACLRGVPDCVSRAKDYFTTWMNKPNENQIPPNYRSLVYCVSIREGTEKEWNFAFDQYIKEQDANQKNTLQSAMSCTRISWLISKFLNDQLNISIVRPQDALSGLRAAASRAEANLKTWNFIKENWDTLFEKYGTGLSFARLFNDVSEKFNTQTLLDDFATFFDAHPNQGSATREIKISRDKIKANVAWLKKNLNEITQWLNDNVNVLF